MLILLYIVASIFSLFASIFLFSFFQSKEIGLLLFAVILFGCATLAINLEAWWPFLLALGLGWILRLLGLDPGYKKE